MNTKNLNSAASYGISCFMVLGVSLVVLFIIKPDLVQAAFDICYSTFYEIEVALRNPNKAF